MVKIVSILLTSAALFIVSFLSGPDKNNISIEQRLPSTVLPGKSFVVSITISKGDNDGFARLLQTLPAGYVVEPIETQDAQFIVSQNDIRFIWTQLPTVPAFTISYKVIPPALQQSSFQVGGLFSYIKDDETIRLPVSIAEVEITGSTDQVNDPAQPKVDRRMIKVNPETGEYAIILTIHPTLTTSTAFIDRIPSGFVAEAVDTYGSAFSFQNQEARFVWTRLKDTASFNIMYKVRSGKPSDEAPVIEGMMVYGEGNDEHQPLVNVEERTMHQAERQNESPVASLNGNVSLPVLKNTAVKESQPSSVLEGTTLRTDASTSQKGLAYKVQILATRHSPSRPTTWVRSYYSLNGNVESGQYEGWNKYSIGTFPTYREASAAKVRAREIVKDAFVVAFQHGNRIPVPEALRIEQLSQ